ncbi:Solute carrier family 22 member 7 [Nymphon striatum]|nr:Solute carrier family 22 member 7 [Nymphon striatum]
MDAARDVMDAVRDVIPVACEALPSKMLLLLWLRSIPCFNATAATREALWDLVCDRAIILELMSRLYIGSTIAGYLIFGYIGDRFGRRRTILVSISGLIVCGFILAFSVNWVMFAITRFWIGLFLTGTELNCFVWMMESVNSKWRDIFGMISMMSWSIGLMYLNAVSYMLKDWTFIQVSITIPCLVSFFITIYALESPRWLMSVDRNEECIKTVNKIFEMNKRPLPEQDILLAQVHSVECSKKESKMFKCMNLFRRLQLRRNSIVIFFIGFSLNFMNFPLMLTTDLVVDETFFNMTVTSALEVIGVIVATIELRRYGRKCPVFCNIMIGSILNFSIHVIPEQYAVNKVHRMTVAILGRIFLTSAGFQIIIYAIELLPTTFRTLGIGLLSMFSRLGVVLAEVFLSVDEATFPWASTFVKLCFCLVAAFISLLLPETKNHDLPSNIEELCQESWNINGQQIDSKWTANGQQMDSKWTANGQQMDSKWTANGQQMDSKWTANGQQVDSNENGQP